MKLCDERRRNCGEKNITTVQYQYGLTVTVQERQAAEPMKSRSKDPVEEVHADKGTLDVSVNFFGRPTPMSLGYWEVELI